MKVNVELDLTPEELRRLFGLPDVAPVNDALVEKLREQMERGLDGTLVKQMVQSMVKGGTQGFEAYQSLLSSVFGLGRGSRPSGRTDAAGERGVTPAQDPAPDAAGEPRPER